MNLRLTNYATLLLCWYRFKQHFHQSPLSRTHEYPAHSDSVSTSPHFSPHLHPFCLINIHKYNTGKFCLMLIQRKLGVSCSLQAQVYFFDSAHVKVRLMPNKHTYMAEYWKCVDLWTKLKNNPPCFVHLLKLSALVGLLDFFKEEIFEKWPEM